MYINLISIIKHLKSCQNTLENKNKQVVKLLNNSNRNKNNINNNMIDNDSLLDEMKVHYFWTMHFFFLYPLFFF